MLAAPASRNHITLPEAGRTNAAGYLESGFLKSSARLDSESIRDRHRYRSRRTSRMSFSTSALDEPVTTKATSLASASAGSVNVTRRGGGLGESSIGAIIAFFSSSCACAILSIQIRSKPDSICYAILRNVVRCNLPVRVREIASTCDRRVQYRVVRNPKRVYHQVLP